MIKVTLGSGKRLAIGFSHPLMNEALPTVQKRIAGFTGGNGLVSEVIQVRHSHCTIVELDPLDDKKYKFISEGVARCNPLDHFIKEKGRRISLNNALLDTKIIKDSRGRPKKVYTSRAGLNKQERQAIWEAYFNRNELPSVPFSKMSEMDGNK